MNPNTKSLSDFLEELNQYAERAFGRLPQQLTDSLYYAKVPSHLKQSINLAYFENGTHDQLVAILEQKRELNGKKTDMKMPIPTMTTTTTTVSKKIRPQKSKEQQIICRYCKKLGHVTIECRKRIRKEQERKGEKQANERPKQKHTHIVHTAEEQGTQQTCAGMAEPRVLDPKCTELKILFIH